MSAEFRLAAVEIAITAVPNVRLGRNERNVKWLKSRNKSTISLLHFDNAELGNNAKMSESELPLK